MKNTITFLFAIFLFNTIEAQTKLEISPSAGYLLNGKIQFVEGVIDIKNQPSFGVSISTSTNSSRDFELDYTWASQTDLIFRSNYPLLYSDFKTKIDIHNISLSYINYFVDHNQIRPFFNVGVGTAIFNVKNSETAVRLSFNLGLGVKYDINNKIGIRVQTRYIAPVIFEGVGIYAGVGTGGSSGGLSLNASIPMSQLDFRAGLIFKIGNQSID